MISSNPLESCLFRFRRLCSQCLRKRLRRGCGVGRSYVQRCDLIPGRRDGHDGGRAARKREVIRPVAVVAERMRGAFVIQHDERRVLDLRRTRSRNGKRYVRRQRGSRKSYSLHRTFLHIIRIVITVKHSFQIVRRNNAFERRHGVSEVAEVVRRVDKQSDRRITRNLRAPTPVVSHDHADRSRRCFIDVRHDGSAAEICTDTVTDIPVDFIELRLLFFREIEQTCGHVEVFVGNNLDDNAAVHTDDCSAEITRTRVVEFAVKQNFLTDIAVDDRAVVDGHEFIEDFIPQNINAPFDRVARNTFRIRAAYVGKRSSESIHDLLHVPFRIGGAVCLLYTSPSPRDA